MIAQPHTRYRWVLAGFIALTILVIPLGVLASVATIPSAGRPEGLPPDVPPEKREVFERRAQEREAARQQPQPPKDPSVAQAAASAPKGLQRAEIERMRNTPPGPPYRDARAGRIIETGLAPFPAGRFLGANRWIEFKDTEIVVVYAGTLRDPADPDSTGLGGVIVERQALGDEAPSVVGQFPTPAKSGSVFVESADGERLVLVTDTGQRFTFDVASLQYTGQ